MKIYFNDKFYLEKKYCFDFLIKERVSNSIEYILDNSLIGYKICLDNGFEIVVEDHFFSKMIDGEYYFDGILSESVSFLDSKYSEYSIPVVYGSNQLFINNNQIIIKADLVGFTFFLLTGLNEVLDSHRDKHDRFPGTKSILYKLGILDRPVLDEYSFFLQNIITGLDNNYVYYAFNGKVNVTCDVDWPIDPGLIYFKHAALGAIRAILIEKRLKNSISFIYRYLKCKLGFKVIDYHLNNVYWIMDVNEEIGNEVIFFFIPTKTSPLDTDCTLETDVISNLLIDISRRGHSIGMHPGYNTINSICNMIKCVDILVETLSKLRIKVESIHSRQHFLRWDIKSTASVLNSLNVNYDYTMGYADVAGFKAGTSRNFYMFDLVNRTVLKIIQIPLIVMESTVISKRYESLGYSVESLNRFVKLKERSLKFGGNFNVLWHNCHLMSELDKKMYLEVIK